MGARSATKSGAGLPKGIYRRGDQYWIRVRGAHGKLVRKSCGATLEAAVEERDRIVSEREARRQAGPTSLPRLIQSWLARHELRSRPRTIEGARQAAGRLLAEFGPADARDLTEERLADYVRRRRQNVGVESVNTDLKSLKAILRLAVRQRVLDALPFHVELLPAPLKKRIPQAIPPKDFEALLRKADELDAGKRHTMLGPILRVAYVTGLRHQELLHLDWADLAFDDLLVRVRAKPGEDFVPKSHCERDVPIPAWLASYLGDYRQKLKHAGERDPVFQPTRRNRRRTGKHPLRWHEVCHQVKEAFEEAGLAGPGQPVGLHALRHSYCTNLVRSGADVEQLRALAGHSSIVVSQRYLWSDSASRRAAAEKMFEMVGIRPPR